MVGLPSLFEDEVTGFELVDASDAAATADRAVGNALDYCARQMGLMGPQAAVNELQQGNPSAHEYFEYALARQVAEYLGSLDEQVQSVYLFNNEATPEDAAFAVHDALPLLHLLVCTGRKTEAFSALVASLDRTLMANYRGRIAARPSGRPGLLDVQAVDDKDVANKSGFAALLHSLYRPPLKVWAR
jgi:hypothetical protein